MEPFWPRIREAVCIDHIFLCIKTFHFFPPCNQSPLFHTFPEFRHGPTSLLVRPGIASHRSSALSCLERKRALRADFCSGHVPRAPDPHSGSQETSTILERPPLACDERFQSNGPKTEQRSFVVCPGTQGRLSDTRPDALKTEASRDCCTMERLRYSHHRLHASARGSSNDVRR